MLGAIIGDIAGSRFERHNNKSKSFYLFDRRCSPTDDSVMSLAVAKAILECRENYCDLSKKTVYYMQKLGRMYPNAGYGGRFRDWLYEANPQPYNSWGNGSAMRVSAAGFAATSLEEAIELSRKVTEVTHNHPEGIKGAEATAVAVWMAKTGKTIDEIKEYINDNYYRIDFTLDEIRDDYKFDASCGGTVPQALEAFFESTDFTDVIRNAVSIGGDSDTIAAIAGGIAEAYYGIPKKIRYIATAFLPMELAEILNEFEEKYPSRTEESYGVMSQLFKIEKPTKIDNDSVKKAGDISKDVQFFMFAEAGAMGDPGEISYITKKHGRITMYQANALYGGFDWSNVYKIFPDLDSFFNVHSDGHASDNKHFYHVYLGMGNHLFVRKRLQGYFNNAFRCATQAGEIYQYWNLVAFALLEQGL